LFRNWLEDLGAVERRVAEVNGQPGVVFFDAESQPVLVIALDIAGGQVIAVRTITNPEKLRHLRGRPPGVRKDRRTVTGGRPALPGELWKRCPSTDKEKEETCDEGQAEVSQEDHRVRGFNGRGTSRNERNPPGAEGCREPRPQRGRGGLGKRRAREDR